MKIYCHNGILPNPDILKQYGIKIQDTFRGLNDWDNDAYIIELPENLKILHPRDLPQIISAQLNDVIVDEKGKIIGSLGLSAVSCYELERIPEEKQYDYHCFGVAMFYSKGYPSPTELEKMSDDDLEGFIKTIREMKFVQPVEKSTNNYIESTPDYNMVEPKTINRLNGKSLENLRINNSILVDENKTLNLIRQEINNRGVVSRFFAHIPETFDEISPSIFVQMKEIDEIHQKSLISRDDAIEMMANLFEKSEMCKRFKDYVDDLLLAKLEELLKLMEIKYLDLLHSLNTGKIDLNEFQKRLAKLKKFEENSMNEILSTNGILKGHSK